jgi:hypothetical protein
MSNVALRRFIGLDYSGFVNEFAGIAAPLTRVCCTHAHWHLGAA